MTYKILVFRIATLLAVCFLATSTPLKGQSLPVTPFNDEEQKTASQEQLLKAVEKVLEDAALYQMVVERLNQSYGGTAKESLIQGTVRLKVLENLSTAIVLSDSATETFRWTVLEARANHLAAKKSIAEHAAETEREIKELSKNLRVNGDSVVGDANLKKRVFSRIQTVRELAEATAEVEQLDEQARQIVEAIDSIRSTIDTYADLVSLETDRNVFALQRGRAAKRATDLTSQTESLFNVFTRLKPLIDGPSYAAATPVTPDTIAPATPPTQMEFSKVMDADLADYLTRNAKLNQ
jgi:hypothetical protein